LRRYDEAEYLAAGQAAEKVQKDRADAADRRAARELEDERCRLNAARRCRLKLVEAS
jgi:hypothetical protein